MLKSKVEGVDAGVVGEVLATDSTAKFESATFESLASDSAKNPLASALKGLLALKSDKDESSPSLDVSTLDQDRLLSSGLAERLVKPCLDLVLENSQYGKIKVRFGIR